MTIFQGFFRDFFGDFSTFFGRLSDQDNSVFNTIPQKPQKSHRVHRRLFCSPHTRAHSHAHTLPSFKEGERVNLTPVKYHGGRNYKISTYRNPRPRLVPVCQESLLIKPSQAVSTLSFFPSPWLPAVSRTLLRPVRLAAGSHSNHALNDYSLSRSLARAAFPLFPRHNQPPTNPQPSLTSHTLAIINAFQPAAGAPYFFGRSCPPAKPIAVIHASLAGGVRPQRFCSLAMTAAVGPPEKNRGALRMLGVFSVWQGGASPGSVRQAFSRGPCHPPCPEKNAGVNALRVGCHRRGLICVSAATV